MTVQQHLRFWLIGLAVAVLLLWLIGGILMPFLAGMAIAYMLDPVADRLEAVRMPRWLATSIVLVAFILLLLVAALIIVPVIAAQVAAFVEALPRLRASLETRLTPMWDSASQRLGLADQEARDLVGQHARELFGWLGSLVGGVIEGGLAVFDLLSLLIITPIVAFYLLRDWDHMVAVVCEHLPRRYAAVICDLGTEINVTLAAFVRGQGLVCLILGTYYAIALTVVGLDFGILVGLTLGLLSFIPYVGSILGLVLSISIALVQYSDWVMWLVVGVIFVSGQAIEGNVLTPKLVGDSVGLHPVWVMFALMAGGSLMGFTGILIAVPVAAAMGVLVRFGLRQYLDSRYFSGETTESVPDAPDTADLRSTETDSSSQTTTPADRIHERQ